MAHKKRGHKQADRKKGRAIKREEIFHAINEERDRQDKVHPLFHLKKDSTDDIKTMTTIINNHEILAILVEEIGEIGKALQGEGDLEEELIQAAAVCIRWLEIKDPTE